MTDKNILEKLVKDYHHIANCNNRNKCIGFGYQSTNRYYFSISGAHIDYVGSIKNIKKHNNNYNILQNKLAKFMAGKKRKVTLASLGDNCETIYINISNTIKMPYSMNFYNYYYKYFGTAEYSPRTFGCVERKIIFSGFKNNHHGTVYISMSPCKLCLPFLNNIRVVTI